MINFLLFISLQALAALDTGNGSDGACNLSGNITARVWNCTTLITSGIVTVTDGYVPLVFKVQGDVTISHNLNLAGQRGYHGTGAGEQDGTNRFYAVGLAGGFDGGDGRWLDGGVTDKFQTSGAGLTGFFGSCGNSGEDSVDANANCPIGNGCGGGGGGGGSWGTNGSNGTNGTLSGGDGLAAGCDSTMPTTGSRGGSGGITSLPSLDSTLVGGAGGGGGGLGYVDDGIGGFFTALNGTGGAGGGAIKIVSAGSIDISGNIDVSGGDGGNADPAGDSGGGGAGAGGTIFIQSLSTITITSTLNLLGGTGGTGANNGANGGNGGLGRLRFDTPTGASGVDITGATITPGVTPSYFTIGALDTITRFNGEITSGCGVITSERGISRWILSFLISLTALLLFSLKKLSNKNEQF